MQLRNSADPYGDLRGTAMGYGASQVLDYGSNVRIHVGKGRETGKGSEDSQTIYSKTHGGGTILVNNSDEDNGAGEPLIRNQRTNQKLLRTNQDERATYVAPQSHKYQQYLDPNAAQYRFKRSA